jgi:hypothetical protein
VQEVDLCYLQARDAFCEEGKTKNSQFCKNKTQITIMYKDVLHSAEVKLWLTVVLRRMAALFTFGTPSKQHLSNNAAGG